MLEFRCISHINHIIPKTEPSLCPTKGINHNSRTGQPAFQLNCRAVGMPPLAIGPQAEAAQSGRQNGARRARRLASMSRISKQRQGGTTARRLQKQLACCHAQALQLPDMHAAYTSATILKKAPARQGNAAPCCMLTRQGSNIMPAAAMQGMLPDAFLVACIYRCT